MWSTYFAGAVLSLTLIVALGAQNALVLRQGFRREHVLLVCLTCAISDALLMHTLSRTCAERAKLGPHIRSHLSDSTC